mmetsp:Transcript_16864/g.53994  ORF Transcript_16864/g.53994 Transcript_16864/m.53994 type:complete len:96 (+) Transcript_16864:1552-1839(+)
MQRARRQPRQGAPPQPTEGRHRPLQMESTVLLGPETAVGLAVGWTAAPDCELPRSTGGRFAGGQQRSTVANPHAWTAFAHHALPMSAARREGLRV